MNGRYTFTRAWGAITAGIGWIILVGSPVSSVAAAMAEIQHLTQLAPAWRVGVAPWIVAHPMLFIGVVALMGLAVGVLIGGVFIVAGQRPRIAVDSLRVQLAMLERLDALLAQRPGDGAGGRFSGLSGEVSA